MRKPNLVEVNLGPPEIHLTDVMIEGSEMIGEAKENIVVAGMISEEVEIIFVVETIIVVETTFVTEKIVIFEVGEVEIGGSRVSMDRQWISWIYLNHQ